MRKFTWLAMIAVTFLTALGGISGKALGKSTYTIPKDLKKLNKAEEWVITMVRDGDIADLEKKFGKKEGLRQLRARFLEALLTNEFNNLSLHQKGIIIYNAVIKGKLDLKRRRIKHNFQMKDCTFENEINLMDSFFENNLFLTKCTFKEKAIFQRMNIKHNAFFDESTFRGAVDFVSAAIGGHFGVSHVKFDDKKIGAIFNSIRVKYHADFQSAIFEGPVDFIGAYIGWQFRAEKAEFRNKEKDYFNKFNKMRVGGSTYFEENIFNSEVCLTGSYFLDLIIKGKSEKDLLPRLILDSVIVERNLIIENTLINELYARNLQCKKATLENNKFQSMVDMRHSSFQILFNINNFWPESKAKTSKIGLCDSGLWFAGMTYQCIESRKEPGCPEHIKSNEFLKLLKKAEPNLSNYTQLESYFRRCGIEKQADRVYIAGKRRELLPKWPENWYEWAYPNKWGIFIFWDLMTGYGRSPGQVMYFIMPIIIIGFFAFNPKYLNSETWQKQFADEYPICTRFLLSFDRFLPLIDLKFKDIWEPKPDEIYKFTWIWWQFQFIAGWILVPIALTAIAINVK